MANFKDLTGQTRGSITVVRRGRNNKHGQAMWWSSCACSPNRLIRRQQPFSVNCCNRCRVNSQSNRQTLKANSERHHQRIQTDPTYRAEWIENITAAFPDDVREEKRQWFLKQWSDPKFREKRKRGHEDLRVSERYGLAAKTRWEGKAFRTHTIKARRATEKRPPNTPTKHGKVDTRVVKSVYEMLDILRRRRMGQTLDEVAAAYRCNRTTISKYCCGKKRAYWYEEAMSLLENENPRR